MQPILYYCYDAYCGWCYGNSKNILQLQNEYAAQLQFEVLSGGMVISNEPKPISAIATYIQSAYKIVEANTGVQFGKDYLWHIFNADKSDWFPSSEKPAIALCVFKEMFPELQISFINDLQYALFAEGRDLCDNESYRHLLEKYKIDDLIFYEKLQNTLYKEKAYNEFALCRQLQVTGFPTAFIQMPNNKFYTVANGYMLYEKLKTNIELVLKSA
jgi:putative protein-disulfide isomerase